MAIDLSQFHLFNVADSGGVWNVLSSRLLYIVARETGCAFFVTSFVHYECLAKPRNAQSAIDEDLQRRFVEATGKNEIQSFSIDITDLQEDVVLENRHRMSKGELSSMAFARKTGQAFLTDDQGTRKLAAPLLERGRTQTTPHLFGWLIFGGKLTDNEKRTVIEQHKELGRPLEKQFDEMYEAALLYRLMATPRTPDPE